MEAAVRSPPMLFSLCILLLLTRLPNVAARTRHFEFNIGHMNVTKLCSTKTIVGVNGQFPGPAIRIKQGDHVSVKVNNLVPTANITIHWHGVRQLLSAWQDGAAYITQCPIQPNDTFTYTFKVNQVGTLFWHAHIAWLRGTVYGAFVIKPRTKYPFPAPDKEETILLGDWFSNDLQDDLSNAVRYGRGTPVASTYTINGRAGPRFHMETLAMNMTCSREDTFRMELVAGKTHLLRIINAALEQNLFFSIANHSMTVVESDASYTKPITVKQFMIMAGQTVSVLVKGTHPPGGRYYMAASPWRASNASFLRQASLGIVEYVSPERKSRPLSGNSSEPVLQQLPSLYDEALAESLQGMLRSLNSKEHPVNVPRTIDKRLYMVVTFNQKACPPGLNCTKAFGNYRVSSSINNVSFVSPSTTSLMEAWYNKVGGVYTTDFPENPPRPYDYASETLPVDSLRSENGTRASVIPYGANVQVVLQTPLSVIGNSTHPFHLHGYDFYVVGQGKGNYNATRDEPTFNLVDPSLRNSALIPLAGWVAIRFQADNPGVWLFHCHMEGHVTFGMEMVFIVENGKGPRETLLSPPKDLPKC